MNESSGPSSKLASFTASAATGYTINNILFLLGLTQSDVAATLDISQSIFGRKLRGIVNWSLEDLYLTAQYLGLSAQELLPTRTEDGRYIPADPLSLADKADIGEKSDMTRVYNRISSG